MCMIAGQTSRKKTAGHGRRLRNSTEKCATSVITHADATCQSSRLVPPADGRDTTGEVIPSAHGFGPVGVSFPGHREDTDHRVIDTAKTIGSPFKYNENLNAGDMIGTGKHVQMRPAD